jgi:prepilin-type N-terminal cleavage/methylation domain-containing protein
MRTNCPIRSGFTLLEILLVVGILVVLSGLVLPTMFQEIESARLPESARQMRSLLQLTRAHAMYDGKRYRIRFLEPGEEEDLEQSDRDLGQPLIEREDDPIEEPAVFNPVREHWTEGATLLEGVRCVEVRLGKPTLQRILDQDTERQEELVQELGDVTDELRPPLYIEPDGTSEWATFVVTNAPEDAGDLAEELEDYPMIEVILDGFTGLVWLQRPFYEEELAMLEENHWPPVLRRDFLDPRALTEEDVIEIQESIVRQ